MGLLLALHSLRNETCDKHTLAMEAIHVEQDLLGEAVGAQDQVSAAYGGFNRINFHPDGSIEVRPTLTSFDRLAELQQHLALYFTGFSRAASEVAQEQVRMAPQKTRELHTMRQLVARPKASPQSRPQGGDGPHSLYCASRALAINSKSQIIGQSLNCETNTRRAVLWDKGSIIDLNAAIPPNSSLRLTEIFNINDRGEIVGRGLPAGCDSGDACGHIFLLIPCDRAGTQGCQNNADTATRTDRASVTTSATTTIRDPHKTKEVVAQWRTRLAQRYQVPMLAKPKN